MGWEPHDIHISVPTWIPLKHLGYAPCYEQIVREWNRRTGVLLNEFFGWLWDVPYIQPLTNKNGLYGTQSWFYIDDSVEHATLGTMGDGDGHYSPSTGILTYQFGSQTVRSIQGPRLLWDERTGYVSGPSRVGQQSGVRLGFHSRFENGTFFNYMGKMLSELHWFYINWLPLHYSDGNEYLGVRAFRTPSLTPSDAFDFTSQSEIGRFVQESQDLLEAHSTLIEWRLSP